MNRMIHREYVHNFWVFSLLIFLSTTEQQLVHGHCEFFLSDNKAEEPLIHYSLFWCKFTKFISFFSKKTWKSFIFSFHKRLFIPPNSLAHTFPPFFTIVIHIVIHYKT